MRTATFTICSNNYVPHASLLFDSIEKHMPDADRFLILVDVQQPGMTYPAGCEVIEAASLNIPDFPAFAFRYDIMELNTAVKPYAFLNFLADRGYEACLYFDPDIELFSSLPSVMDALASGASFTLTPHLLAPAEQPETPDDMVIMRAGVYNLGFLGASSSIEALDLLSWWARRLLRLCVNEQSAGLFVDQKFMDLIPGFSPAARILHDPGLNVAYWNLSQRRFARDAAGQVFVNDQPLGFFHYSGFDPRVPDRTSKYTPLLRGADLHEPLRSFLAEYAERLLAAGHGSIPFGLYAYGRFASGLPIANTIRHMFRETYPAWAGDPFQNYEEWLYLPAIGTATGAGAAKPTPLMLWLRERYPWLQQTFDPTTPGGSTGLIRWWIQHGTELGLEARITYPTAAALGLKRPRFGAHRPPPDPGRPDVTVVGYLRTESGVGEVGRRTVASFARAVEKVEGLDVDLGVVSRRTDTGAEPWLLPAGRQAKGRLTVFNINPDQLPQVIEHLGDNLPRNSYRVCIPFWELSRFPADWLPAFDQVDEVWAPTRFIQAALSTELDLPVIHLPVALEFPEPPAPSTDGPLASVLRSGRPYILFAFDFLSFVERKNPLGAVKAFRQAFGNRAPADRPLFVIKSQNAAHVGGSPLYEMIGPDDDVLLLDETLDRGDTLALVAGAACVLSLHRGEGLGLLVAEAMAYGVPVVATDYGGSTDLLTPETGYPVDYRLVAIREGQYPFAQGKVWADADVTHAAWHLRSVFDQPQEARRRAANARKTLRARHGTEAVARAQCARLRVLGLI